MNGLGPELGRRLYALLPELYRQRDNHDPARFRPVDDPAARRTAGELLSHAENGDLARYLLACGDVLDLLHETLAQRRADCFPDNPPEGPACQDWLLPYFARLLDVRLVSPHVAGRRDEVADAVWLRQRKGTLVAVDRVVEAITQSESVVHEGWRRVVTSYRVDRPLLPARVLGEAAEPDPADRLAMARHPGLPAASLDLSRVSRAVRTDADNPAAQLSDFSGRRYDRPREDDRAAARERTPTPWRIAERHAVPCFLDSYEDASRRSVDLRTPTPHQGLHHPKRLIVHVPPPFGLFPPASESVPYVPGETETVHDGDGSKEITGDIALNSPGEHRFERVRLTGTLTVTAGRTVLRQVAVRELRVSVPGDIDGAPVLDARDCLFGRLVVLAGTARLEYCTVLEDAEVRERLLASEGLFAGDLVMGLEPAGCLRFSRAPRGFLDSVPAAQVRRHAVTSDPPVFVSATFGEAGCGVLADSAPDSIARGAEDGTEMGAYHAWRYAAEAAAVADKLADFLPVGLSAVVRHDPRLLRTPPRPV